ncbi:MAG: hypothetical protein Q4F99_06835 [bacterium]|nr:hypothetical protein [bacterium]
MQPSFTFIGCADPASTAEDWVDAMLENDKEELFATSGKEVFEEYQKALASQDAKALMTRYLLENLDITHTLETENYARVYFSLDVPAKCKIANLTGSTWLPNEITVLSNRDFKGAVAHAYLTGDSDADCYGDDAIDFIEDAIYDVDEITDAPLMEMAEAEAAKAKAPADFTDSIRNEIQTKAREGSIEMSQKVMELVSTYKFEEIEDFFDGIDILHEEPTSTPSVRTTYITIEAPEAGYIELIKDIDGNWRVTDICPHKVR